MSQLVPHQTDQTRPERRAIGKSLRKSVPRTSHGQWLPVADRPDPITLLQAQDAGRIQHLLPIKYGRMLASPFAFFRGSAVIMAADLAHTPVCGLNVILCGDAHLSNFGFFASPERKLVFDLNDFDEAHPGPWEWDLKRLVASAAIAGRDNGFSDKKNHLMAAGVAEVYRKAMRRFAKMRTLDVWYYHVDSDTLIEFFDKYSSKRAKKQVKKVIANALSKTQEQTLAKLTRLDENGRRQIKADPPLLVPYRAENLTQFVSKKDLNFMSDTAVDAMWRHYLDSLDEEKRFLLSRYRIMDGALRVGGVGSVGTRCTIVLLQGGAKDDALILQLKEAGESALAAYLPPHPVESHAHRVVTGQQLMQTTTDIFLGWHKSETTDRDYYWRQLKDMKGSIDVAEMDVDGLKTYVEACALCLARAHARTGDAAAIAGYLGKSKRFNTAVADFALAYADQTEKDYEQLARAIKDGKIAVETGI